MADYSLSGCKKRLRIVGLREQAALRINHGHAAVIVVLWRTAAGEFNQGGVVHAPIVSGLTCGGQRLSDNAQMTEIRSPLTAQIVQWLVAPGDTVREGDVVLILEAMKMEHTLTAPFDGTVAEVNTAAGDQVQVDALLVKIDTE